MLLFYRFFIPVFIVLSIMISLPKKVNSQEITYQKDDIISVANTVYGSDNRLVNGKYYKPKHFFAEGHPYFISKEWLSGTIFIKGIQYENIQLKYNIVDDIVIIRFVFQNRIAKNIILNNSFVDSLIINTSTSHIFHNTNNYSLENPVGFAELIYRGNLLAYYKHTNEFVDELNYRNKYGKYLNPKRKLFLFDGDSFKSIKTKKDFVSYFPIHDKEVKLFIRKNNIRFKTVTNEQIVELIRFCDKL